ncbi:MAG: hypothetical protein HKN36_12940 [Hellea sp.]|nr:hypothetical protein [Hellea sp.]
MFILNILVGAITALSVSGLQKVHVVIPIFLISILYVWYRYDSLEGAAPEIQRRLVLRDKRLWIILSLAIVVWIAM